MELLRDVGNVESRFDPFGDSVSVGARYLHPLVPYDQKLFWMHPMVLLGDEAEVEAHFDPFGDCANLDAESCMFAPNVP